MSDRKRIQIALATSSPRANGVLLLLAVHIIPQTAKHPAFCPTSSPEDTELQPSTLVSVLTYRLCPLRRVPPRKWLQ
jgi:hypothetical protein